jgi:hypothetical protein
MNWPLAIARNRDALLAVVAAIAGLLGGRDAQGLVTRHLRNAALALLRPAESAARRLIVIAARGLRWSPGRSSPRDFAGLRARPSPGLSRPRAFPLFDRRKRYVLALPRVAPRGMPRIRTFSAAPFQPSPAPPPALRPGVPDPDASVDAARLLLRLTTLERALADLPKQARRLARWRAKEGAAVTPASAIRRRSPLRIGRPPGWRARPSREIDLVLRDCHALALDALAADTS